MDKEILVYTRVYNEKTSDEDKNKKIRKTREYIQKIKLSEQSYDIQHYLNNFEEELDYEIILNELDLEYWYDNLNILNFGLLDYIIEYRSNVELYNRNNNKIKEAFIYNLFSSVSTYGNRLQKKYEESEKYEKNEVDKYFEFKNEVRFAFCFKYFYHRLTLLQEPKFYIDHVFYNNILKYLKFNNLSYFGKDYFKGYDEEYIEHFLCQIIYKRLYYINKENLEVIFNKHFVDSLKDFHKLNLNNMISFLSINFCFDVEKNLYLFDRKKIDQEKLKYYQYYLKHIDVRFFKKFFEEYVIFIYESCKFVNSSMNNHIYFYRCDDINSVSKHVRMYNPYKDEILFMEILEIQLSLLGFLILCLFILRRREDNEKFEIKSIFDALGKCLNSEYLLNMSSLVSYSEEYYKCTFCEIIPCLNNISCSAFLKEAFGRYNKSKKYDREYSNSITEKIKDNYRYIDMPRIRRYFTFKLFNYKKCNGLVIFQLFLEGMNFLDVKIDYEIYEYLLNYTSYNDIYFRRYKYGEEEFCEDKYRDIIIDSINTKYDSGGYKFYNLITKYSYVYLKYILQGLVIELSVHRSLDNTVFVFSFDKYGKFIHVNNIEDIHRYKYLELCNENCVFTINYSMDFSDIKEYLFIDINEFNEYDFDMVKYVACLCDIQGFIPEQELSLIEIHLLKEGNTVEQLNFEDYTPVYYKDKIIPFLEFIITSNEINNDKYEEILSSIGFRDQSETYEIKLDKNTKINDVIRKIANDEDKVGSLNEDKLKILTKLGFREE